MGFNLTPEQTAYQASDVPGEGAAPPDRGTSNRAACTAGARSHSLSDK